MSKAISKWAGGAKKHGGLLGAALHQVNQWSGHISEKYTGQSGAVIDYTGIRGGAVDRVISFVNRESDKCWGSNALRDVKIIILVDVRMTDSDLANLSYTLRAFNFSLDGLLLQNNLIGNHGVACLMNGINSVNYQTLYDPDRNYTKYVSEDRRVSQSVGVLDLSGNQVTDVGAGTIAETIRKGGLASLKCLKLHDNPITDNGYNLIMDALNSSAVHDDLKITFDGSTYWGKSNDDVDEVEHPDAVIEDEDTKNIPDTLKNAMLDLLQIEKFDGGDILRRAATVTAIAARESSDSWLASQLLEINDARISDFVLAWMFRHQLNVQVADDSPLAEALIQFTMFHPLERDPSPVETQGPPHVIDIHETFFDQPGMPPRYKDVSQTTTTRGEEEGSDDLQWKIQQAEQHLQFLRDAAATRTTTAVEHANPESLSNYTVEDFSRALLDQETRSNSGDRDWDVSEWIDANIHQYFGVNESEERDYSSEQAIQFCKKVSEFKALNNEYINDHLREILQEQLPALKLVLVTCITTSENETYSNLLNVLLEHNVASLAPILLEDGLLLAGAVECLSSEMGT